MRGYFVCGFMVASVALGTTAVSGQQADADPSTVTAWSFDLFPRVGFYSSEQSLGPDRPDGRFFGISGAMTLGLSAQLSTPVRWLDMRAVYDRTVGADLIERVSVAGEPCGFNCAHYVVANLRSGYAASSQTGGFDAVVRPWANQSVRPYAFLGIGFQRYAVATQQAASTTWGYHFGLGADLRLGPLEVQIEAGNTMTRRFLTDFGALADDGFLLPGSHLAVRRLRHDLVTGIGFKLRRWPFED